MISVSDFIVKYIEYQGIKVIFSLSGGMISNLEDAVFRNGNMKLVSVKHEQAGGFAAEGYARVSGLTGVAMGTSGPGATNLITSVASSFFDSTPVLYITGQVNTNEITVNNKNRQTGFQETDIVSMVKKITKFSHQISNIEEIPTIFDNAFKIMHEGRKGPVLIDIPMNMQKGEIDYDFNKKIKVENDNSIDTENIILDIQKTISGPTRPIILIGGGVKIDGSKQDVIDFSLKYNIPVVSSLMGLDSYDHTLANYLGMIGSYGNRYANISLANSDLIFVFGSRLDIRQTGAQKDKFGNNAKIIHVDIDNNELGYTIQHTTLTINMKLHHFFSILNNIDLGINGEKWLNKTKELKKVLPIYQDKNNGEFWDPNYIVEKISEYALENTIFVNDVGQNQMWTSQSLILKKNQQLLNSGGMGSMGFSLPASIGAFLGKSDYCIVSFNGDGGFQINLQELETISHHKIPIIIIVFNNSTLGMIREFQDTYFEGRNIGTILGYSCPNLQKIAYAFDIEYNKIDINTDINTIFKQIFTNIKGPKILEIICSQKSIVTPKIMFGNTIDNQRPFLSDDKKDEINKILAD